MTRIKAGKRRIRSDANINFVGTLKWGDDVLEAQVTINRNHGQNTIRLTGKIKTFYKYMFEHLGHA